MATADAGLFVVSMNFDAPRPCDALPQTTPPHRPDQAARVERYRMTLNSAGEMNRYFVKDL
jgi:hypothetical protein